MIRLKNLPYLFFPEQEKSKRIKTKIKKIYRKTRETIWTIIETVVIDQKVECEGVGEF